MPMRLSGADLKRVGSKIARDITVVTLGTGISTGTKLLVGTTLALFFKPPRSQQLSEKAPEPAPQNRTGLIR